jgi:DNA-binding HxlR family transcriptional regulator
MLDYKQFCPVAKAAEVFGERWTPMIVRELCFGPKTFGDLLRANPLISRTVLAQRLKELSRAGVAHVAGKPRGKGHIYTLTEAGQDFRPIIDLLGSWGQRWGQGMVGPDDMDSSLLVWGMRRQIDPQQIPEQGLVLRFDFRGIPKGNGSPRRFWMLLGRDDIEICLKDPNKPTDVVVDADLGSFTKVWLGYAGLSEAIEHGRIYLNGNPRAVATARRLLKLADKPTFRTFVHSPFVTPAAPHARSRSGDNRRKQRSGTRAEMSAAGQG